MGGLNTLHKNFHGIGDATVDTRDKIVHGHAPGGVAILWHTRIEPLIKELHLNVNWAVGIEINIDNKRIVILNVYTPYECHDNEPEYVNCLAHIAAIIDELNTTCVYVVGDYNADIADEYSLFAKHLLNSCRDTGLKLSSKLLLPYDSFTFVSNWETTSWLDHYVCSSDAHDAIHSMEIYYNYATTDHIPVAATLNASDIPDLSNSTNSCNRCRLDWSRIKQTDIDNYCFQTDVLLKNIKIPTDALLCKDVHCKHVVHANQLCKLYEEIVKSLNVASEPMYCFKRCDF